LRLYEWQIKFVASLSGQSTSSQKNAPTLSSKIPNRFSNHVTTEFIPASQPTLPSTPQSPRLYAGEVASAAKWWASRMRQHDLSQQELNTFEQALRIGIEARCDGHWYPSDPRRGSGHRSVVNDLTIDPLLTSAAATARIRDVASRLPRAVLWINPGGVRVQVEGERAPQVVYPEAPAPSCGSDKGGDSSHGSDEEVV
jgi:hypothetical protein